MTPYTTPLADILPPAWWRLRSGAEVTSTPLRSAAGGFARLSYKAALAAAELFEAEFPARADVLAMYEEAALVLDPVTLPVAGMTTESAAREHDRRVAEQLADRGHDGLGLVVNIGKWWLAGAPPGRSWLIGWRRKDGSWIQEGLFSGDDPGPHGWDHCDYSSLAVLVRRGADGPCP